MDVFTLTMSLSFGVLGAVLLHRKFDAYFGCACLLTATFGYINDGVLMVPYFLVIWRVLLGRRIRTDTKLLIGQLRHRGADNAWHDKSLSLDESQTSSNSFAHWIVAVEEGNEKYRITHAVGNVVSGKGEKKKYKSKERQVVKQEYLLHHVGWVTRKAREQHMEQVREKEKMASGYTCQEFAVDIAFQLSCSRTYTFMRLFTLLRLRTAIYFVFLCFGGVVFLFHIITKEPVIVFVTIDPYLFNPFMITNVFIAMEAYRLGYTNLRREQHWWGGLKDRLSVYFRVISYADMLKLCFVLVISIGIQMYSTMLTLSFLVVTTTLVARVKASN